jgi:pyruvate decarboxylase
VGLFLNGTVLIARQVDMSHMMCDASGLKMPLRTDLPPNNPDLEKMVVDELRSLLEQKSCPIIIVDENAVRNNVTEGYSKLSTLTGLPTFTTAMGKGHVEEKMANFGGEYSGACSYEPVQEFVETADAVIWLGNFPVCSHQTTVMNCADIRVE